MQKLCEQLNYEEFSEIYNEYIYTDFPAAERRPLRSIKKLYAEDHYKGYALREGGQTLAYASFMGADGVGSVLLDYFAVSKALRGTGVGSRFLQQLRGQQSVDGILIECETPATARTQSERQTRERRIEFYRRGGAQSCGFVWHAFSVDYDLLWLPVRRDVDTAQAMADIQAIYNSSLPTAIAKSMTKIKRIASL